MGRNLHKNFLEVSGMALANMANPVLNLKKALSPRIGFPRGMPFLG
jgi:hypothetical protein